ncbi:MAG: NADP-dependent isocitrate dehydrogenase [Terriglobia bacterium]
MVTLLPGDGVGPEVTGAARRIVEAAGAAIEWDEREAGAEVFKRGLPSGVPLETIESIHRTHVVLKGPLTTPVGYGEKSANVTLRKLFETYGNIRPVRELPGVPSPYSGRGVDLVVVRENIEDLYAGIEYMQTPGVAEGLKLISRTGCEKIVRLAFEFARSEGRARVHCATKSNIMKLTEGMMKRTFEEIAPEYPGVQASHIIIDNCAHQLVKKPEQFDVIVTTNMNGDIISDLSSALVGGLGFAPSANIGNEVAIFEAVHGSAPKYAGKDVINPTAVVLSSVMMLRHLGEFEAADKIEHAVLVTLEEGKARTGDVVGYDKGVSTSAFTGTVIGNLGKKSTRSKVRPHQPIRLPQVSASAAADLAKTRTLVGVDVFIEYPRGATELGHDLEQICSGTPFSLKLISNRGTKVYPAVGAMTDCVDHWRCRFVARSGGAEISDAQVLGLVQRIAPRHRWVHLEKLLEFDGKPGFTKDQGED